MARLPATAGFGLALLLASLLPSSADDAWNPFKERDQARNTDRASRASTADASPLDGRAPLAPMDGLAGKPWQQEGRPTDQPFGGSDSAISAQQPAPWSGAPPAGFGTPAQGPTSEGVQRTELQPLSAPIGAQLPGTFWQGIDQSSLQVLIAPLSLPPRSAALAGLWQRLWSDPSAAPAAAQAQSGTAAGASFDAVRLEVLYRSGLLADLSKAVGAIPADQAEPVTVLLVARTRLMVGDAEAGCTAIKGLQRHQAAFPKPARHEFLVLAAYCGTRGGDAGAAGLAADLLRTEQVSAPVPLAVLDALAAGTPGAFQHPAVKSIGLIDYRFVELARAGKTTGIVSAAEPALLAALAMTAPDTETRILAAEAAAAAHIVNPADLATAYRSASFPPDALASPFSESQSPPLKRALLFKALEADRTPIKKARLARALLDDTRRAQGPYMQVAAMLGAAIGEIRPAQEIGWFAETAIEIALAANRLDTLAAWTEPPFGERYGGLKHWLVLADIGGSEKRGTRGEHLPAVEQFAVRGRLSPELMHRLVTVLDALDYQIPIPLWEAASRSPQPTTGHLPETGILSQLQDAAKRQEQGRVVLTAIRAFGPDNGASAHMIALGDTIRALKRAGLEQDARRLGLEALYMGWPRSQND